MIADGMDAPIYKKKKDFAGLQAADHYAWEQYHFLMQQLIGSNSSVRGSFQALLNAVPKMHVEATRSGLIRLCEAKGIDPRTGVRHGEK
jgi:hypothetical protein